MRTTRLLERLRERIGRLHYGIRSEQAYVHWIRAFVHFLDLRHPVEMGGPEVDTFLSWLEGERTVAATHKQALSELVFLYLQVLGPAGAAAMNARSCSSSPVTPSCTAAATSAS